jgi:hypothetical protein
LLNELHLAAHQRGCRAHRQSLSPFFQIQASKTVAAREKASMKRKPQATADLHWTAVSNRSVGCEQRKIVKKSKNFPARLMHDGNDSELHMSQRFQNLPEK